MNKNTIKLCIIDTGVKTDHPSLNGLTIEGISIEKKDGNICINKDYDDNVGHGTGVCSIIYNHNKEIDVFMIKLFDSNNMYADEEKLFFALNYIINFLECDILNMSIGACNIEKINELYELCNKLKSKGVIIVSAFENGGAMSFPAAFDNVIGVTSSDKFLDIFDLEFIENCEINIAAKGSNQKIAWIDPLYKIGAGNSFACAHVSGIISKLLFENISKINLINVLKDRAIYTKYYNKPIYLRSPKYAINKAVIFPFNKEMHSLLRYQDLLRFEIVDVFDTKYSAHIGSSIKTLQNIKDQKNHYIKNIDFIDYNSFDTFILGHVLKLKKILKDKIDILNLIFNLIDKKKNIYACDDINEFKHCFNSEIWERYVYSPTIINSGEIIRPYGKLYRHNVPVLCVCGTSSMQGKFTLQLELRRKFIEYGYEIGQLGTEPTSFLFGMDECFHYGYHSNIQISRHETIAYLNESMYRISQKKVDIILTGSQSGVITQYEGNLFNYPLGQYEFLLGVQPDIVVLCVNIFDTFELIERSLKFVEGGVDCKVISIVVSNKFQSSISSTLIDEQQYKDFEEKIKNKFSLPVYRLGEKNHIKKLVEYIIEYLS